MKKVVAAVLIIVAGIMVLNIFLNKPPIYNLKVGDKQLKVEIAKTAAETEKGLSDRKSLCENCGMLFVFDKPDFYTFWMREMYFDIDIIWITKDEVVDITLGAKKPSSGDFENPKITYSPSAMTDRVLEVNAGWAEKNGIKRGDKVILTSK